MLSEFLKIPVLAPCLALVLDIMNIYWSHFKIFSEINQKSFIKKNQNTYKQQERKPEASTSFNTNENPKAVTKI